MNTVVPLLGWAGVRIPRPDIPPLRRKPGVIDVPPAFLRNADEQTVGGVTAAMKAFAAMGKPLDTYAEWGVLAAPMLFGRDAALESIDGYLKEGAWGVSPHLIPQHSVHAVAGAVSLALKTRGLNFGVQGGANPAGQGFLAAFSMLDIGRLPGLFLVLTDYEPEKIPLVNDDGDLMAIALALGPKTESGGGFRLHVDGADMPSEPFFISDLIRALESSPTSTWRFPGVGTLTWTRE